MESAVSWLQPWSQEGREITQAPEAAVQCPTFLIQVWMSRTSLAWVRGSLLGQPSMEWAPTALGGVG